jgi:hypothetical protein
MQRADSLVLASDVGVGDAAWRAAAQEVSVGAPAAEVAKDEVTKEEQGGGATEGGEGNASGLDASGEMTAVEVTLPSGRKVLVLLCVRVGVCFSLSISLSLSLSLQPPPPSFPPSLPPSLPPCRMVALDNANSCDCAVAPSLAHPRLPYEVLGK